MRQVVDILQPQLADEARDRGKPQHGAREPPADEQRQQHGKQERGEADDD